METKVELSGMTSMELRKLASKYGVKNYGKMVKVTLVDNILSTGGVTVENDDFTDRHEKPIHIGDTANFRVQNKWFKGVVTRTKVIDKDQYVYALLEGCEKEKMFHTLDCEVDKVVTKVSAEKSPSVKEEIIETVPEPMPIPSVDPEVGESKEVTSTINVVVGEDDNGGFPITKYHDLLKGVDKHGIRKNDVVTFEAHKSNKSVGGEKVKGKVVSFIWDKQGKCPYFGIMVGERLVFKKPGHVTK